MIFYRHLHDPCLIVLWTSLKVSYLVLLIMHIELYLINTKLLEYMNFASITIPDYPLNFSSFNFETPLNIVCVLWHGMQWDTRLFGHIIRELAYVINGNNPENRVSILQVNVSYHISYSLHVQFNQNSNCSNKWMKLCLLIYRLRQRRSKFFTCKKVSAMILALMWYTHRLMPLQCLGFLMVVALKLWTFCPVAFPFYLIGHHWMVTVMSLEAFSLLHFTLLI